MARDYFVYILASESRELYIGVTNSLKRRICELRSGQDPNSYKYAMRLRGSFTSEMTRDVLSAIAREKRLKRLSRKRKLRMIDRLNPGWRDLAGTEV